MTQAVLYVCYQSVREPLTLTQVVAYLEGLARAGHVMVLLTFEPQPPSAREVEDWRERLAERGIIWYWCRYHKRPTVPATAFDIIAGSLFGVRLAKRHGVRLVHARGHVPGLIGLFMKRLLGTKLLFDVRGLMAEEYADAGVWPAHGRLYRATKRVERGLVRWADGLVVLTEQAKVLLASWYATELGEKPVRVIPCCVDLRQAAGHEPAKVPTAPESLTLVYVGKIGGWYLTEEMVAFVAAAADSVPSLRWDVWTQSDPAPLHQMVAAHGIANRVAIGRTTPEALAVKLRGAHAGLSFIKPCFSKRASSPTKVAEYLAAGLPVVSTAGIGDTDGLLRGDGALKRGAVGVVVDEVGPSGYRPAVQDLLALLADPETPQRCREVARREFDLEAVGWTRYRSLYEELLGPLATKDAALGMAPSR